MKIASIFARYLLGLIFTVFGMNGFLHFIHQPPPANPRATLRGITLLFRALNRAGP